ncbi:transcriptional regulator of sugar metabolism [Galbibacter orientalis DSM 19592]|uniref:Transcriptional regulator of sugar metabolism n=1 Tax=Galbibacter orientalis DSM 19592 TaxID=926559 RepID=I3C7H8_9FLAO|nr:DeoR/GlpR family DNA-binding transcription regulator [Galbibacter orientalis]EIJ39571.1 transcriptional regulator of sugar metabolism [Galbibacter orientalis DSM 19592]
MQKKERQDLIIEEVRVNRNVTSTYLAQKLNVSEDTIRRDLNELDKKGLVMKVHGGAVSTIQKLYHYNEEVIFNRDKKDTIAKKAGVLLKDGMVIIISGGTTNLMFAKQLPETLKATVYTYSLPIAMQLSDHPTVEVIFIGGKINKKSMVTVGIDVVQSLSQVMADICFIGVSSINELNGLTDEGYEVSLVKKAMIAASDKVVALATSNKLNIRQNYSVCGLEEINTLVTEIDANDSILQPYKNAGILIM